MTPVERSVTTLVCRFTALATVILLAGCAEGPSGTADRPVTADQPGSDTVVGGAGADLSGVYAPAPFVARPEVFLPDEIPFTEAGRRSFDAFDPLVDNPRLKDDCAPETMPGVLWLGAPMAIEQYLDRVVLRFERGGVVRDVPFGQASALPDVANSELGVSAAHWDGDALVIETARLVGGRVINNQGFPLSNEATLTERYWRESGEMDLRLEVLVTDPVNYAEPFTIGRVWVWAPNEQLRDWECVDLGSRETDIDIEELARQLEALEAGE